ncbi:MAG: tRNA sulfurtransferase [Thermoplasmata archaeon]
MKLLSLISGGIDSPVATYLMLRRGDNCMALHFDNQPFTDDRQLQKAKDLVRHLGNYAKERIPLHIVPHGKTQIEFARHSIRRFGCVFCRRMMLRVGERIASNEGCEALVTGESLGQVASQTLSNIGVEEDAVDIPILRPLIGFDKVEIERIARDIGTYEISIRPGLCCTIVPEKPATLSNVETIWEEERKVGIEKLVEDALENVEIV